MLSLTLPQEKMYTAQSDLWLTSFKIINILYAISREIIDQKQLRD